MHLWRRRAFLTNFAITLDQTTRIRHIFSYTNPEPLPILSIVSYSFLSFLGVFAVSSLKQIPPGHEDT
jgi:hypothetical protein